MGCFSMWGWSSKPRGPLMGGHSSDSGTRVGPPDTVEQPSDTGGTNCSCHLYCSVLSGVLMTLLQITLELRLLCESVSMAYPSRGACFLAQASSHSGFPGRSVCERSWCEKHPCVNASGSRWSPLTASEKRPLLIPGSE